MSTENTNNHQGGIYDKDVIDQYKRMQNFTNDNYWSYGNRTNNNPYTAEGQAAIVSNYQYAQGNVVDAATTLASEVAMAGLGKFKRYISTTKEIDRGAEAIVESSIISPVVKKSTSIPRQELHIRNTVPNTVKTTYRGTKNGISIVTQPKRNISRHKNSKLYKQLDKDMKKKGWDKVEHPNLQGRAYSNGKWVISDIKPGNITKPTWRHPKIIDVQHQTPRSFRRSMQKQGGRLINKN